MTMAQLETVAKTIGQLRALAEVYDVKPLYGIADELDKMIMADIREDHKCD